MGRRGFFPWVAPFLALCALCGSACAPDLGLPPGLSGPGLEVQVEFKNHHAGVSGSWSGTLEARSPDVPQGFQGMTSAEKSMGSYPAVVPTQRVNFPVSPNMCPGRWTIRVTVSDDAGTIIDIPCTIDIPASFGAGIVGLKVIEGSDQYTSGDVPVAFTPPIDVSVLPFTVPGAVDQGDQVTVDVVVANLSTVPENFTVRFSDRPASGSPGVVTPLEQTVAALQPNASITLAFRWNTAGASVGSHELAASVDPLSYEQRLDNNRQVATVQVKTPPQHDVEVTGVTVAGPVIGGGVYPVTAAIRNNGDVGETVTVNLADTPPGGGPPVSVGTSSSLVLGPRGQGSDTATYTFPWNTGGVAPGLHTLTARIPPLPGESSTLNNAKSADVTVERHDVEAVSLLVPAAANVGNPVQAVATVRNNGNVAEGAVSVTLRARPPAGLPLTIGTQTVSLGAGESRAISFDWSTACIPAGGYTLTVAVAAPNDGTPANDSVSASPITLAIDHELRIAFVNPPATVPGGTGVGFVVNVVNNNSISEPNIDVSFTDNAASGPPGAVQRDPRLMPAGVTVLCGETKELVFMWFPPSAFSASHQLTVTIVNVIPGDNPADNSQTITVNVQ